MTDRLELNWSLDGYVTELRYYCSETPLDLNNLPSPKTVLNGEDRSYIDLDIEIGKTYYIRIGAVRGITEKFSEEKMVYIAALFDPVNISTVKVVLDSNSLVTKDSSNRVSVWTDRKADVNFLQASTGYMPTATDMLNSLPVLVFNNSYLESLDTTLREMWNAKECIWAFCVYKSTLENDLDKSIFNIKTNNSSIGFSAEAGSPSFKNKPFSYARINGYGNWAGIGADSVSLNEWVFVFYEINFATNTAKISVNGILKTVANLWTPNQGKTEALSSAGLGIGNSSAGASFKYNGSVAAIIAGSGSVSLTTAERQKLEGWAAHKYDLTSKLPSDHPYVSKAPN